MWNIVDILRGQSASFCVLVAIEPRFFRASAVLVWAGGVP
jgi:hypothetical protein